MMLYSLCQSATSSIGLHVQDIMEHYDIKRREAVDAIEALPVEPWASNDAYHDFRSQEAIRYLFRVSRMTASLTSLAESIGTWSAVLAAGEQEIRGDMLLTYLGRLSSLAAQIERFENDTALLDEEGQLAKLNFEVQYVDSYVALFPHTDQAPSNVDLVEDAAEEDQP